ncbi:hypothetical protein ACUY4R_003464 [Kosakonia sp. BK9b]
MAIMQRVPLRASPIYKTVFLLHQKDGSEMRAIRQNPAGRRDYLFKKDANLLRGLTARRLTVLGGLTIIHNNLIALHF